MSSFSMNYFLYTTTRVANIILLLSFGPICFKSDNVRPKTAISRAKTRGVYLRIFLLSSYRKTTIVTERIDSSTLLSSSVILDFGPAVIFQYLAFTIVLSIKCIRV